MLSTLVAVVLLVVGAALLTAGSEAFAENVSVAASRTGLSVVGLSLLLAGAEPEEAVTTMLSARQGHFALAAGDAIGANLVVLTLVLGLAALVTTLPVTRRVLEYAVAAAVGGAVAVLLMLDGVLSRLDGGLLVLLYLAAVAGVWWREHEPPMLGEMSEADRGDPGEATGREATDDAGRPLLMVLLGLVGMTAGGYLAVRGAAGLVGTIGLTGSVVGLVLLALATSAEMLALVWSAGRRGLTEVVVAGAVGAVAYNATVSLGLAGLVNPLLLGRHAQVVIVGVVTSVLPLVLLLRRRGRLPRGYALPLVAVYLATVLWLFRG